ncbi:RNA-binding domain-containing protein [Zhongshania guokunii]|uniref:RNA-binding domain-containing protein n=1 Tax=Zhongshania guokunii TaxID=641783 RepID=A0ABV3U3H2_9GAMM
MINNEPAAILGCFLRGMIGERPKSEVLAISKSNFGLFQDLAGIERMDSNYIEPIVSDSKFDIVLGDFPIGLKKDKHTEKSDELSNFPKNWCFIYDSLCLLNDNGIGLFVIEPTCFNFENGKRFRKFLGMKGFFVSAFFNMPEKILEPETGLRPVLVCITRSVSDSLYVGEMEGCDQAASLGHAFIGNEDSGDLLCGTMVPAEIFRGGFSQLKAAKKIDVLSSQYGAYEKYALNEIAEVVNSAKTETDFEVIDNTIYIRIVGKPVLFTELDNITGSHRNYLQLVLKPFVNNEYLRLYFQSTLGQLILESISTSIGILRLSRSSLSKILVSVPSISIQREIIATHKKLGILKGAIDVFDSEISLNPTSSVVIQAQLDSILDVLNKLTDSDRVRSMARFGEDKHREFKESLSLCISKGTKEKYIETAALKTIVAFLNSEGGTLLVGVSDRGEVKGVDSEIEKFYGGDSDKFFKHFKNKLKERIGEQYYPFFDYRLVDLDARKVLEVSCRPASTPCYLDGIEFYVRTNPASDQLHGPKLVEYVRHRFPN